MKKLISVLMIFSILFSFIGCDVLNGITGGGITNGGLDDVDKLLPSDKDEEKPNDGDTKPEGEDVAKKTYNDFTMSEKALFTQYIGAIIPFIPNDEYYLEGYYEERDFENGINFYTVGNTEGEFASYLKAYSEYELKETYEDEYGDTWYCYVKDGVTVDLSYYEAEGKKYVDVYVYSELSDNGGEESKTDKWREQYDCITVGEALIKCLDYVSSPSPTRYYIIATVTEVQDETYGQIIIEDETGSIMVYGTRSADGSILYGDLDVKLEAGDVILIYGTLQNYKGNTPEVQNAWLIDYIKADGGNTDDGGNGGNGGDGGNGGNGGNTDDGGNTDSDRYYTSFTSKEEALLQSYFGFTIPFLANDEYYVEEYTLDNEGFTECGINFYTYGNTKAEFTAYLDKLSEYELVETYQDEYGDTWYCYDITDTVMLDLSHYEIEGGEYVVDIYIYEYENGASDGGNTSGGNTSGGNTSGGNTSGGYEESADILTNKGAGLPSEGDGVFDIDMRNAKYVKDVTDQGYYLDGCPTVGSPAVLVIPVEFSDSTALSKGYTTDKLAEAFLQGGKTDYYSVYDYYYISSYGKLSLDITVLDYWFKPQYSSSYYYGATYDYYGEEVAIGDQLVLDEALAYLSEYMDLSKYDSDNNGVIDSVILINTLDVGEEDFYWAYRYWNIYTDDYGYYYEYDGVSANDYIWASYQFLYDKTDENGNSTYTDTSVMNTYTYIHEFAHVLGVDDYYDTEYINDLMMGLDIMDSMTGDHNPYTKFNLGWITSSRLVVTSGSVTLKLDAFCESGDTLIIANNWDESLGAYQEYYVIMYYKNEGLNAGENAGYFLRDGVVVYHVNSSLYREVIDGETYYDVYNNNTDASSEYGTPNNLIELVKSASDTYTYIEGDTLPGVTDDNGEPLGINFVVDSILGGYATLTFYAV